MQAWKGNNRLQIFHGMARTARREISRQEKLRHLSQFFIFVGASLFRSDHVTRNGLTDMKNRERPRN